MRKMPSAPPRRKMKPMFSAVVFAPKLPAGTVENAVAGAFPVKHADDADVCIVQVAGGVMKADALEAARRTLKVHARKMVYLCGDVDAASVPRDLLQSPRVLMERGHTVTECLWLHCYRMSGGLAHA